MDFLSFFRGKKSDTASMARDRLMIAVGVQRGMDGRNAPTHSFMPQMREEILAVVRKYVQVPDTAVHVNVQKEEGLEVLVMNLTLPESRAES
jgi:cell division topological specificity factor